MSDNNVIKFRKPEPKKPQKAGNGRGSHNGRSPHNGKNPHNGRQQHSAPPKGRGKGVPPFVLLFFAAAAIGGVMYVLDQQKPAVSTTREAAP